MYSNTTQIVTPVICDNHSGSVFLIFPNDLLIYKLPVHKGVLISLLHPTVIIDLSYKRKIVLQQTKVHRDAIIHQYELRIIDNSIFTVDATYCDLLNCTMGRFQWHKRMVQSISRLISQVDDVLGSYPYMHHTRLDHQCSASSA